MLGELLSLILPRWAQHHTPQSDSVPREWSPLMLPLGALSPWWPRPSVQSGKQTGLERRPSHTYQRWEGKGTHVPACPESVCQGQWSSVSENKSLCVHSKVCLHREQVLVGPNDLSVCILMAPNIPTFRNKQWTPSLWRWYTGEEFTIWVYFSSPSLISCVIGKEWQK